MITSSYTKETTWKRGRCSICGRIRELCQHHIDGRRNTDEVIWICSNGGKVFYTDPCHQKVHNPKSFGLPPTWAYDNGYLRRLDGEYRKKKRNPKKWQINK
jgi:hypothetical protein